MSGKKRTKSFDSVISGEGKSCHSGSAVPDKKQKAAPKVS
jgi:hypothetical protein